MGQAEEYAEEKPSITFENIQWSAILNYYFSKALVYKSFGKLTFRNNRFRHGTNRVLGGLDLENIPSLNELVWDRNEIENSDFLEGMFGSLIEAHRGLTSITVSSSCANSVIGTSLLRTILDASICNTNLTKIDLASNNIETGAGAFLSNYISKDTPLQMLSLKGNKLNDNDALQIAQALHKGKLQLD